MSILKNLVEVFKPAFCDDEFITSFLKPFGNSKTYQKETAENIKQINNEIKKEKTR